MRVPEDYLRVTRWYAKAFEQGSSCMPQGMDADLPETGVIADSGERADERTSGRGYAARLACPC
jgi:hypothetical protein